MATLEGQCRCGQINVSISLEEFQDFSFFCHCPGCQSWASAPLVQNIYMKNAQPVTKLPFTGEATKYTNEMDSHIQNRFRCSQCGVHIANAPQMKLKGPVEDPQFGFPVTIFAKDGKLPSHLPKPKAHIYYSNRMVDIKDELPKYPLFGYNSKPE